MPSSPAPTPSASARKKPIYLGRGSYGSVYVRENLAYKKFTKLSHCLQEYAALHMLEDCQYTVKARSLNLARLEIAMELYDFTLRDWLRKPHSTSSKDIVFLSLLRGCIELHSRDLAHGDLKPSNILMKSSPLRVVLGDLGFVAKAKYAKCSRTAPAYRDPLIVPSTSHDIFSLAIIFLEMYYGAYFGRQTSYERIFSFIKQHVPSSLQREVLSAMVSPDHHSRPSASDVLARLYPEDSYLQYQTSVVYPNYKPSARSYNKELKRYMSKIASTYGIHRSAQGYLALTYYIEHSKLKSNYFKFYARVMMMLLSSIFGSSGYGERQVLERSEAGSDFTDLEIALTALLHSPQVMSLIYY